MADESVQCPDRPRRHGEVASQEDAAGLIEATGKWVLPTGEGKITQPRIDYAFTLVLDRVD
jgi:hypothetical protein